MSELSDFLKPYVTEIERSAAHGNKLALEVVKLYRMYAICPNDPGAAGLCLAAFHDWERNHH